MPGLQPASSGKLLSTDSKSRYVDSVLLHDREGGLCEISDSDQDVNHNEDTGADENTPECLLGLLVAQAISGAIPGNTQSMTGQHPGYEEATKLWNAYVQKAEPLCKVPHIPSVAKMVSTVSKRPPHGLEERGMLAFCHMLSRRDLYVGR
ncbi:Fungal specific transcription factor, putative [Penicillium digitatum]|uniref:Fungal specific transcription factor, putative n=3 Tax=Penicillium digitatum TaxID=36651 RepID=K9FJ77_PEND2|nr:Fungal specific transcription factor, putative [Penicillium digitatum Pd1]EKV08079.1 Fungal specific transcription factor, putative [Penicillium digitatum Pd1]EKV09620.1 Fungal specific transcription factor, putative [Penicillium digitatum PHI26]QQK41537.1 Fungal specific transcription factor, putative [Penicillium digitatum]